MEDLTDGIYVRKSLSRRSKTPDQYNLENNDKIEINSCNFCNYIMTMLFIYVCYLFCS